VQAETSSGQVVCQGESVGAYGIRMVGNSDSVVSDDVNVDGYGGEGEKRRG